MLRRVRVQGRGVITGQAVVDLATGLQVDVGSSQRWQVSTHAEVRDKGKTLAFDTPQWFLIETRQVITPAL